MSELLEVVDLCVEIRTRDGVVRPVDRVSLTVRSGETLGLVGESGSGKTMTGMSILRLLPGGGRVTEGSIHLDGRDLTACSESEMRSVRGNEIAVVFQDPMTSLNPTMTVGRQIGESVVIHRGASVKAARARALEVLDMVGVPRPRERLDVYPHQLSGGLRQRVMIAMALACEPKLLIADEPTTALDVTIQKQILALLDDLRRDLGMGMLLITHDMGVIAGRADRVMVMYAGRIVEAADTETLYNRMRHPYTEALLESIPALDQDPAVRLYSIPGVPPSLSDPPNHCRFAPRCRHRTEQCLAEDPPLTSDEVGHPYACFNPVGVAATAVRARSRKASDAAESGERPHREPLVVLENVVKEFSLATGVLNRNPDTVKAVSDVSFSVNRGETFGVVGESGCGKTTLGRMIVALESADAGRIVFDGQDITELRGRELRRRRRDLQLVFQDPYASLDPRMRVASILREFLVIQGISDRGGRDHRVRQLLAEVGLPERALDLYPHEFSGGQRQRLGFARALTLNPQLIVADEPVSSLDVSIRSQILNLMKRLQQEHDLTYIIISHDLSVVRYMADRLAVMYLGKLVEIGPAEDVFGRPAHHYTAALLEAIPVPDPIRERSKAHRVTHGELPSAVDPPSGCRFRTRCPAAQVRCEEEEPPLVPFGVAGHYAACHFPLQPVLPGGGAMLAQGHSAGT
jgi:peptide/nickel transport system ATP-binding protein